MAVFQSRSIIINRVGYLLIALGIPLPGSLRREAVYRISAAKLLKFGQLSKWYNCLLIPRGGSRGAPHRRRHIPPIPPAGGSESAAGAAVIFYRVCHYAPYLKPLVGGDQYRVKHLIGRDKPYTVFLQLDSLEGKLAVDAA